MSNGISLDEFLQQSEVMLSRSMDESENSEPEYPLLVMQGISDIERRYFENLDGFLRRNAETADDLPLLIQLSDTAFVLGYVTLCLKTIKILNTLKNRKLFIMPDKNTAEPVDDALLMQFICQDITTE